MLVFLTLFLHQSIILLRWWQMLLWDPGQLFPHPAENTMLIFHVRNFRSCFSVFTLEFHWPGENEWLWNPTQRELHCKSLFLLYLLYLFYLFTSNVYKEEEIITFLVWNTVSPAENSLGHAPSPQFQLSKKPPAKPENLRIMSLKYLFIKMYPNCFFFQVPSMLWAISTPPVRLRYVYSDFTYF